jgi:prepilin-type N-terminal cleavage/methylation domain-containing protein
MMKKNGFTIVEFLVVIFIISLLSGLSFTAYRTGEKIFALQRSAQKLAQDIRIVEEMAISARICDACAEKKVPPGGYGIYFNQGQSVYSIYADLDGNGFYNSATDIVIETVTLEKTVIQNLSISPLSINISSLSINFEPPDPKVTIGNSTQTSTEASITISLSSDPSKTKTIKVNKAGLIYVE